MSIWSMMNWAAWGLCVVFALLLAVDFIRVERDRAGSDGNGEDKHSA